MKTTRPLEYVCFGTFALPAKLDSKMWAFIAIDVHTGFVFLLDISKTMDSQSILSNVKMLLEEEDFKKHMGQKFTLIFTENKMELRNEIYAIISGKGGGCLFDNDLVSKELNPIIKDIYLSFDKLS